MSTPETPGGDPAQDVAGAPGPAGAAGPEVALRGPGSVALPAQRPAPTAGHGTGEDTGEDTDKGTDHGAGSTDPGGRPGGERLKLLLVGSSGGHLAQLAALAPWSDRHQRHWVCFDTPDALSILADEQVTWAFHPTTRHLPNLVRNAVLALRVLRRERPDVVLSTGAGVAWPFFVLARLLRIPTVYLEVYDRLDTATLTGRLCRPFASRMLVQWDEQRGLYRDAEVVGCVL